MHMRTEATATTNCCPPAEKHSQYSFRHRDFLQLQCFIVILQHKCNGNQQQLFHSGTSRRRFPKQHLGTLLTNPCACGGQSAAQRTS
jgi:hypothetical protein